MKATQLRRHPLRDDLDSSTSTSTSSTQSSSATASTRSSTITLGTTGRITRSTSASTSSTSTSASSRSTIALRPGLRSTSNSKVTTSSHQLQSSSTVTCSVLHPQISSPDPPSAQFRHSNLKSPFTASASYRSQIRHQDTDVEKRSLPQLERKKDSTLIQSSKTREKEEDTGIEDDQPKKRVILPLGSVKPSEEYLCRPFYYWEGGEAFVLYDPHEIVVKKEELKIHSTARAGMLSLRLDKPFVLTKGLVKDECEAFLDENEDYLVKFYQTLMVKQDCRRIKDCIERNLRAAQDLYLKYYNPAIELILGSSAKSSSSSYTTTPSPTSSSSSGYSSGSSSSSTSPISPQEYTALMKGSIDPPLSFGLKQGDNSTLEEGQESVHPKESEHEEEEDRGSQTLSKRRRIQSTPTFSPGSHSVEDQQLAKQKSKWSPEEQQRFIEAVELYGRTAYDQISAHVGTRTRGQVRGRVTAGKRR